MLLAAEAKERLQRRCVLQELEQEEALEVEVEITDLDPPTKSSRIFTRWLDGQRLSVRTRLWMALFTILGVALFSLLLLSPWQMTGASHLEQASTGGSFMASHPAPPRHVQMVVVHQVTYLLDQDGLLSALWTRHKYVYLLWQRSVALSFQLLRVDHNVVYLVAPNGSRVAFRASDGTVLWVKKREAF